MRLLRRSDRRWPVSTRNNPDDAHARGDRDGRDRKQRRARSPSNTRRICAAYEQVALAVVRHQEAEPSPVNARTGYRLVDRVCAAAV